MTTLRDESEAAEIVSKVVAKRTGANRAEVTLSNGIVIEFRPISPLLINSIQAELESRLPQPPRVWLEEKGREEENPNDPDYMQALRRAEYLNSLAITDALTYASAHIKFVPEGLVAPDSDEWLTDPRVIIATRNGLDFDTNDPVKRKVVWIRFYAIESYVDARLFDEVQTSLVGIREEEVQEALNGFRDLPERGEDNGSTAETAGANGNTGNRASRRASSRVRGA